MAKAVEKKNLFVSAFLETLDGPQSAERAGYKGNLAVRASKLLADPYVSSRITERRAAQIATADLSAVRILEELRRLATVDARGFFHADGRMKSIAELTPEQGACLSSFEVVIKNTEAGDGVQDTVHKIKLWDKTKALNDLARHFALLVDKVQVSGTDGLASAIAEGRQRAAARNRKTEG